MQLTILFLLMGGLSIATAVSVDEIKKDLMWFLENGKENAIHSNDHHLQLLNESLGSTNDALVWKALFDGHQEVAIKISTNQNYIDQEIAGYRAANAMNDSNIESKGIPKIYYTGHIFREQHPVIVMTLFDETLLSRWIAQNRSFNAYSTLEVFLQLAETLAYLQSRGVMHNDIKPRNIFFRGSKIFLGDFDIATFNGEQTEHGSGLFASSGYWKGTGKRGYMDNLESLVYTIWYIERIHYNQPAGLTIKYNKNNKRFVMEKCKHFKNFPRSFEALKFICYNEMLSSKSYPNYESIVKYLTAAIDEVTRITGQAQFEWLGFTSPASSASSFSFGYDGEVRPDGRRDPDWLMNCR